MDFNFFHSSNIGLHVTAGTIALLLGAVSLLSAKGKRVHIKSGRWFLRLLSLVILTGLLGVFVFKRNTFLLVITLLSAYQGYSGYRALKTKNNSPNVVDMANCFLSLTLGNLSNLGMRSTK
ncbi:MAG: hypothetical protein QM734_07825 [Cyclobacteriaceae bacterium]